jgi:hypothetical protein
VLTPADASGTFPGSVIVPATVAVDPSGERYSNPFTLSLFPGSPDNGTRFNESGISVVTFGGNLTVKRVIAN